MPGVPGLIERQDLDKLCKTYGKTIHFWQVDRGDSLIMMALTREGQLKEDLARGKPAVSRISADHWRRRE